jgi:hypothetical protein
MRYLVLVLVVLLSACSSSSSAPAEGHDQHAAHNHAQPPGQLDNSVLNVDTEPAPPVVGESVLLKLNIQAADGVTVRNFETLHEKLVHLIVVREGLDEFAHLHPTVDDRGNLRTTHIFIKSGKYLLFADYKAKAKVAAVAETVLNVAGVDSKPEPLKVNAPGEVTADGLQATIAIPSSRVGAATQLRFALADEAGSAIDELEPYLGARGHLVVLNAAGDVYVHAHPLETPASGNEVAFEAHFPASGLYKGWAQFQIGQRVRTVPFVVQIAD